MKRGSLRAAAVLLWLCLMAWIVRYEAFPEWFSPMLSGYSHLLSRDVLVMDSWMKILFKGAPIGYSHTSMDVNEDSAAERYTIDSVVQLKLMIMGENQNIHVETSAFLSALYELQRFSFSLSSHGYALQATAIRKNEHTFKVTLTTADTVQRMEVDIPNDVILYSPMTEFAMKRLKPGQHLTIKTLDPASFSTALMTLTALRKEPLTVGGKTCDATLLSTEYGGATMQSWMDSEGNVLKEDTPFGWTLEKCTANEALTVLHGSAPSPDILAAMSVPCEGLIKDPRHCRKLKLRLKGVPFTQAELELSDRQKVIGGARTNLDLEVSTAVLPVAQLPPLPLPENIKRYLAATPSLQSGDPEMLKKAEAITKGKATAWDKSIALYDWVYNHVSKESTVSLPSALDVLHTLKGDCKEHTYLTVGLARAAGIPARIMVGVVYHEGAFYYHAWPSLYAGRWVEMDPTWGEETVDATHIALIEGELEQQLRLVKVLGQLRIQVLGEYDHD